MAHLQGQSSRLSVISLHAMVKLWFFALAVSDFWSSLTSCVFRISLNCGHLLTTTVLSLNQLFAVVEGLPWGLPNVCGESAKIAEFSGDFICTIYMCCSVHSLCVAHNQYSLKLMSPFCCLSHAFCLLTLWFLSSHPLPREIAFWMAWALWRHRCPLPPNKTCKTAVLLLGQYA